MKKVVLITGCSSGFGYYLAKRLSRSCIVYATTRATSDLSRLNTLEGIRHATVDVTRPEDCRNVIDKIDQEHGHLDVLINNAGFVQAGFFEELSEQEILNQFNTNFFGLQHMTRAALPLLRKVAGSKIINLSSIAGLVSIPFLSAYNASKFAVEGFSESLRFELAPFGVDVLLIQPGTFKTDIFSKNKQIAAKTGDETSDYFHLSSAILKQKERFNDRIKSNPDDVAKIIESYVFHDNPPFRTLIGLDAKLRYFLKSVLPFRLYEGLYKRALKKFLKST